MNISFFYVLQMTGTQLNEHVGEELKDPAGYFRDIFSGEYQYELTLKSAESAVLKISVE